MISDVVHIPVLDEGLSLRSSIIETLRYFHVFRHPLYANEIRKFLNSSINDDILLFHLNAMVREGEIFYSHSMYALENSSQIFLKRLVGADIANEKIKGAYKSAKIIASFPFVKCVCISGSLSKGYADENSDMDFFIVTAYQRLWICRTLLHLFKKLTFLVNSQHSFCMNYFIDEGALTLEEQNIFTATELATLIPAYNVEKYNQLMQGNKSWVSNIFPNLKIDNQPKHEVKAISSIKTMSEWVLNKLAPQKTNNFLMNLTDKLWRYKWEKRNYPMEDYDIAMKTKWYVSKNHPLNYQKKVLEMTASL